MFERILVPVDLTEKNEGAVATAVQLAGLNKGEVWLLHIIEELDAPFEELKDFYSRLEAKAHDKLAEQVSAVADEGVPIKTTVAFGNRAREIVDFANTNDVDLLVLTSHRLDPSDLGKSLMTISHQVALAAHPPVLLLR